MTDSELATQTSFPVLELDHLVFTATPGTEDYHRNYPGGLFGAGVPGHVVLDCLVGDDGDLTCEIESERPRHFGFGAAALRISRYFRVGPETTTGLPTAGGRIRVPLRFQPGPDEFR